MDATTSTLAQTASGAAEPGKRFLDPFAEWRDCANQWDVTEVWRTPGAAACRISSENASGDCLTDNEVSSL